MTIHEQILKKIQSMPDPLVREVNDFIDFLLKRYDAGQDELNSEYLAQVAAAGGAFEWLDDPEEDGLYSDVDGEPV